KLTDFSVMTHRLTSGRDGTSNMEFSRMSSIMLFNPRAPVPRCSAFFAIAVSAAGSKTSWTSSRAQNFWYCVTKAFFGAVRMRMLATALRRHVGDGALQDLEQRLLHPLARDIAGDRGVVRFARDLVDLVDVDDTPLGAGDIEVGGLDQAEQDVLDVLADVARF